LKQFGIRAVVGVSFGEIFASNCLALGFPAVCLSDKNIQEIQKRIEENPQIPLFIDLNAQTLTLEGLSYPFEIPAAARSSLMEGTWDALGGLLDADTGRIEKNLPYLRFNSWTKPVKKS
ncbi:MAG TPA: hypothetical protein VI874_03735, partial [Candidatus Norongarragalinales archaeon]|nr:hypothetical protein [Candidatus Norongarragalinales archaeon]